MSAFVIDTPEREMLRETVAKVASKFGQEYFLERSRAELKVPELWSELGESGLLGVHLPEAYGGGGAGLSELLIVVEELAANGIPLLLTVISPAICGSILAAHASDEMKAQWLPSIADGTKKMAFGLTEPDAGSNSHDVRTLARRDGDGWVISGGKYFISAIDECDAVLLIARDEDFVGKSRSPLSMFVIPTDTPGLSWHPLPTAVVSPDNQFSVFLDEVRVGPEALIGSAGAGLKQVFAGLNPERILAAGISNGIGRFAVTKAVHYARERSVWSTPIGAHQGISHPIAESHIAVELARMATYRAAELFDAGEPAAEAANIAKFAAADASLKALDQSIQTHGGNGLSKEFGLAELWFSARLLKTAPVSREMVLNFVAQTALGLPASY